LLAKVADLCYKPGRRDLFRWYFHRLVGPSYGREVSTSLPYIKMRGRQVFHADNVANPNKKLRESHTFDAGVKVQPKNFSVSYTVSPGKTKNPLKAVMCKTSEVL